MTLGTLRRRVGHADVDGKTYQINSLEEPLLGSYYNEDGQSERIGQSHQLGLLEEHRREHVLWTVLFSNLIVQWAKWLADVLSRSGSVLRSLISLLLMGFSRQDKKGFCFCLSSVQEEKVRKLQFRLEVPFDGTRPDHQNALKRLWQLAYPGRELPSLRSDLWKEMGWQGPDPSTDFRGGGFISLENLIFFAETYPDLFQRLLNKMDGVRSEWEYPFAVAGVNISFMLAQMLDTQSGRSSSITAMRIMELVGKDETAFDVLFCIAFLMMDAQWLAKQASYMNFNEVLKETQKQLERELALEDISSIADLPAYNILRKS